MFTEEQIEQAAIGAINIHELARAYFSDLVTGE